MNEEHIEGEGCSGGDVDGVVRVTRVPSGRARGLRKPIVSGGRGAALVEVSVAPRSKGPAARPWEPSGSIDVEQLAIWAIRDQKADRQALVGLHAIEASAAGITLSGRSSDGAAALADIEHLGCRIDRRHGFVRDQVHPAAMALEALTWAVDGGDLVRFHAALGGRPEGWQEPKRWWRPAVWVKIGEEGLAERSGRGRSPAFCRIIPTITREELVRRRGVYLHWWEALDQLAWKLSMRALGFVVRPPSAHREPWLDAAPVSDGS